MIDKITAKIKKYPFQTGILIGLISCLLLVGFINLFQDNGRTLSANRDIVREDYLRMAINAYGQDRDDQLAGWRYKHLGRAADSTLVLMMADESISPQLLSSFAEAVGKKDVLQKKLNAMNNPGGGTPSSPRKGLSGFGKTILIILGLLVLCAAGFYAASLIKTKQKQKRRAEYNAGITDEPMDVITPEKARMTDKNVPDTLFDLDELFPQKSEDEKEFSVETVRMKDIPDLDAVDTDEPAAADKEEDTDDESAAEAAFRHGPVIGIEDEDELPEEEEPAPAEKEAKEASEAENIIQEKAEPAEAAGSSASEEDAAAEEKAHPSSNSVDETYEEPKSAFDLDIKTTVYNFGNDADEDTADQPAIVPDVISEVQETEEAAESDAEVELKQEQLPEEDQQTADTERPLVETDMESDPDSEDELLRMIRGVKTTSDAVSEIPAEPESDQAQQPDEEAKEELPAETEEQPDNTNDILIHYQSSYRVGNDMYDEVFSIDQGDTFRGECGIGIGETLNNTEPKAVTAFEVWLFDKDDIHTATWYLMSDFAMANDSISERLQQHGHCEQIRKNGVYLLQTETLEVEIRVLDLEYGTEMEEKNSYFTNVTFDVVARSRQADM